MNISSSLASVPSAASTSAASTSAAASARAADGDYKTKGTGHEVKDSDGDYKPQKTVAPATAAAANSSSAVLEALTKLKTGG